MSHGKHILSNAQKFGSTHFVCFPLMTSISRPQFRDSITKFLKYAGNIPNEVVRPLGTINLPLSIFGGLSLNTPQRFATATRILRDVDIDGILAEQRSHFEGNKMLHEAKLPTQCASTAVSSLTTATPLTVTVSGLSCQRPGFEADTH